MSVKRVIFYILAVLICFLLQTAVFEFFSLADVVPNVLLILTVTMGFIRGRKTGIVIGFVCGLLIDIYSGEVLGQYAVLYLLFGYANGWFHARFYEDEILLPIGLLAVNSLVYSFVIFFFFFALRTNYHIGTGIGRLCLLHKFSITVIHHNNPFRIYLMQKRSSLSDLLH